MTEQSVARVDVYQMYRYRQDYTVCIGWPVQPCPCNFITPHMAQWQDRNPLYLASYHDNLFYFVTFLDQGGSR
jgi:hypothetical protein